MSDLNYSPWGGRLWVTIRKSVWCRARPWYGNHAPAELKWLRMRRGYLPFLSVSNRFVHFYIGWKPIMVPRRLPDGSVSDGDPKFYWWEQADLHPGELAVQLGARWGVGRTS